MSKNDQSSDGKYQLSVRIQLMLRFNVGITSWELVISVLLTLLIPWIALVITWPSDIIPLAWWHWWLMYKETQMYGKLKGKPLPHLEVARTGRAIPDGVAQGTTAGLVGGPAEHHRHVTHTDYLWWIHIYTTALHTLINPTFFFFLLLLKQNHHCNFFTSVFLMWLWG